MSWHRTQQAYILSAPLLQVVGMNGVPLVHDAVRGLCLRRLIQGEQKLVDSEETYPILLQMPSWILLDALRGHELLNGGATRRVAELERC